MQRQHHFRPKPPLKLFGVAIALAVAAAISACQPSSSGPVDSVTIGTAPLESSALIYIAERQAFFSAGGLAVTTRQYDTGAASLTGLVKGEVDIATPAEYALVGRAFQKENVRAIASIDKAQYFYLIGRRDRGIENVPDLKGKKIGVVTKTTAEFYLGRFLEVHGMNVGQVRLVDVTVSNSEEAIANGDVDAIVARPPYAGAIERRLGASTVTWPAQSSQPLFAILIARSDWIGGHAATIDRLLRALLEAEEYAIRYPREAMGIVRDRLNVDDAYVATVWAQNEFSLSLDQSLIVAMEDEARWMIQNNLTPERQVPDFLSHVYLAGLKAARRAAVNIVQ